MMGILEDGQKLVDYVGRVVKAGANQAQSAAPQADMGIFRSGYPHWVADGGTEAVGHMCQYQGMAYRCAAAIQRIEAYAPDKATNNYNPYPEPDVDGIYPYVYGMGVKKDMLVRENGAVYRCILNTGEGDYKLLYAPSTVPALFTKEAE